MNHDLPVVPLPGTAQLAQHTPPPTVVLVEIAPIRITHVIELAPEVIELLVNVLNPSESIQVTKQELVDLITGLTNDVTATIEAEHAEVLAAIEAAKNANGDVPPEVVSAVQTFGEAVKSGVQKIFDAAGTPAPTPTPTP